MLLTEPAPLRFFSSLGRAMQEPSLSGLFEWASGNNPDGVNLALAPLSSTIPTQVMTIPLMRRKVMQPSLPPLGFLDPATATGQDHSLGRSAWASPESLRVTSGLLTVGRLDRDRYWSKQGVEVQIQTAPFGMGSGSSSSRGELQTISATLRFDAHLTGLR